MSIARLKLGDVVRNAQGTTGKVAGFTRDHVSIAWGEYEAVMRYTDEELKTAGVRLVEESR